MRGDLRGDVDLKMLDLAIALPKVTLPDNQVSLQASVSLGADQQIHFHRLQLVSRQGALTWLQLSAEQDAHEAVAVVGKLDLATAAQNIPNLGEWVSAGALAFKAEVSYKLELFNKHNNLDTKLKLAKSYLLTKLIYSGTNYFVFFTAMQNM